MARNTKKNETPAPTTEETKAPEATQQQDPTPPPAPAPDPAQQQDPPKQDPPPAPEKFTPYEATVAVPLVVVRKGTTPNGSKPIGTIGRGARVTVTASVDGFAILSNGTYIKEAYLERVEKD